MASSQNSLEENLKCSICLEIFKDPMVLGCSHSFCKACLDRNWNPRDVKECAICRKMTKRTPVKNQALREACESFEEEKRRKISEESQGTICLDHTEKHQLFCRDDNKLVCLLCVSQDHQNHSFSAISNVAGDYKTKLQGPLQELQNKLHNLNQTINTFHLSSTARIKSQVQQKEVYIRAEFEKLHQFLRDEEAARITALREEEKEKNQKINEKIQEIEEVCFDLSERIKKTEDDLKGDESLFIHNYKDIEERTKFTEPRIELDSEVSIDEAKHVGNLKYRVWEKMKDICPYYPVVLVPGSRFSNFQLCKDLIHVRDKQMTPQQSPLKKNQYILGSEGFTSGIHSWTVEVGTSEKWAFGVASESADGVRNHCSLISLVKGKSSWNSLAPKFTKVQVKLYCEEHLVVYTDPDTNTNLQTNACNFPGKLYPCFCTLSQVPLKILPAKVSVTVSV